MSYKTNQTEANMVSGGVTDAFLVFSCFSPSVEDLTHSAGLYRFAPFI